MWHDDGDPAERQQVEQRILDAQESCNDLSQPFFAYPGTDGTLTSPFPELSDPVWWVYVTLWGGEDAAKIGFETSLPSLRGQTPLAVLRAYRHRGRIAVWLDSIRGTQSVESTLYFAIVAALYPTYS